MRLLIAIKYTAAARMQIITTIGIPADTAKRCPSGVTAIIPAAGSTGSTQIKLRRAAFVTAYAPTIEPVTSAVHRAEQPLKVSKFLSVNLTAVNKNPAIPIGGTGA